ncbi:Rrf2 family transcriptional regulator [bacterium]|nr:Rrf2 family transcriptional regulator [bacterium]
MLSKTAEYALRAVVHLAQHGGESQTARVIADATHVPPDYISKILKSLARAGVVNSRRGPNGGFTLARPAREINVLSVVNAIDPIERILSCPLGLPTHKARLCRLHQMLDDAIAAIEKTFAEATIEDFMHTTDKAGRRCPFPLVEGPSRATRG